MPGRGRPSPSISAAAIASWSDATEEKLKYGNGLLGRTGRTYARLRFNAGPGGALEIPTLVDWSAWPEFATAYDLQHSVEVWQEEFDRLIEPVIFFPGETKLEPKLAPAITKGFDRWLAGEADPFTGSTLHEYD